MFSPFYIPICIKFYLISAKSKFNLFIENSLIFFIRKTFSINLLFVLSLINFNVLTK